MNVQQLLVKIFNSQWDECSTATATIDQQSLIRFFNSGWYDSSTVSGMIIKQSLA